MGERLQHRVARPVGDDFAAVEHDQAVDQIEHRRLVRGEHEGAALYEFLEVRDERLLGVVIHRTRGLIEQEHRRPKKASDHRALRRQL